MSDLFAAELAAQVLRRALRRGGDFAELFAERRSVLSLSLDDGRVERAQSGRESGAAVRVMSGQTTYFGYVDGLVEEDLLALADAVAQGVRGDRTEPETPRGEPELARQRVGIDPATVAADRKAAVLRECDQRARAAGSGVAQVTGNYTETRQVVQIVNSIGAAASDDRTRVRLAIQAVARRDATTETGRHIVGAYGGFELLDEDPGGVGEKAGARALTMLDAVPAPVGQTTVVVGKGFGGVLFHEMTGHGLEADAVRKQASIYAHRLGDVVASPTVFAYDDGCLPGAWGTGACDDEGTPSQKTCVIGEGRLASYLYDLRHARGEGRPSTGNGRRQSFRYPPVPRMTNTYIAPGQAAPEEIIADVKRGVYAVSFAGGQVEPATGDFVFGLSEGYLIENGKVTRPIKGATLVGNGLTALAAIDAVANDFDVDTGFCGKAGQSVPVATGQPTVRINKLTVGGTGA